ncbi:MAG: hypothetical protein HY077_06175 [Elusimicrobia bacterium]|nr:hypothetical protein [Elusimicrobiota bacterium]
MKQADVQTLVARSQAAGKTYAFDDGHDPSLPAGFWFQETQEGRTLFLILYTQACIWTICQGCNLPALGSKEHVTAEMIKRQIDHVFSKVLSGDEAKELGKVILSNNGSVLDERTFPTESLLYFVREMVARCPKVTVLTLESRSEYIDAFELELLSKLLREKGSTATIELAVGFEAFDDNIRNNVFKKGLTLKNFEQTVARAAAHGFRLKAYFMLKPVAGMSEEEAVADIARGVDYLDGLAAKHKVAINMHLNPTYVAKGTELAESFKAGSYAPPRLDSLRRAALAAKGRRISLYLGLYDENNAVPGGSFIRPGDEALLARLAQFNKIHDFGLLEEASPS